MSYRTIAHHARSVRLTTSDGVFWLGSREQALPLQKVLISPKGVTTTDLCEVAESEGHAIGVAGVVIVGVAVVVHITEVVGVAGIRRTLPPPSSGTERGKRLPTDRFYRNTPINFHRRLPALIAFQHIGQKTIFCID